jgi:hypothetical protein
MRRNVWRMSGENPLLFQAVQAQSGNNPTQADRAWKVLVKHFFQRFFDNETISLGEQKQARIIQIICALAQPGIIMALYVMSSIDRAYWSRVGDHYFYLTYSLVVTGAVTVFEWDLLFPDLPDVLVLHALPIRGSRLLIAKASALVIFLSLFLFGSNLPGAILFTLAARQQHAGYHFIAHTLAVATSGLFAVTLLLSLQGILLSFLGAHLFRKISPLLQGLALMTLLLLLFLTPLLSAYLQPLLNSNNTAVLYFPPFWFLGLYERLLVGTSALPIFHALARIGCSMTLLFTLLTLLTYPLAYKRKIHQIIEGAPMPHTKDWLRSSTNALLNRIYLRSPKQRAIYHFIGQTLLRTAKHRVYLAGHLALSFALVISGVVVLQMRNGHIIPAFSIYGLRSSVPILAFWLVSGFQTTLRSPVDIRASWVFTLINGGPDPDYSAAIDRWVFIRVIFATGIVTVLAGLLSPEPLLQGRQITVQLLIAIILPLVLTKSFFQTFFSVPFCLPTKTGGSNLPFVLLLYIVVFPPLVWGIAALGPWMADSFAHMTTTVFVAAALLFILDRNRRSAIKERTGWINTDRSEEDFQRLGLS